MQDLMKMSEAAKRVDALIDKFHLHALEHRDMEWELELRHELMQLVAPSEGMKPRCPKCGCDALEFWVEEIGETVKVTCVRNPHEFLIQHVDDFRQFFALSPARSGEPPQCPECHVSLRDETAHYRCDKCHARYSSSLERGLYRLPDDRVVIPAAPQPVSGAAPKVVAREIAEMIANDVCNLTWQRINHFVPLIEAILRPYFPPASQTPAPLLDKNSFLSPLTQAACAISQLSNDEFRKGQIISIAEAEEIIKGYALATPASTARRDGWVSVEERLPKGYVPVLFYTNENNIEMGQIWEDEWVCERTAPQDEPIKYRVQDGQVTHWRELPSAPGSVPPLCNDPDCGDCYDKREALEHAQKGVPQAEPPKHRSCNRHNDCDVFDSEYKAKHKTDFVPFNQHCHDDECEDCFGQ